MLLTIMGILVALFGVCIAIPFYAIFIGAMTMGCGDACVRGDYSNYNRQAHEVLLITVAIIAISIVTGFLPRIIYGVRLRQIKKRSAVTDELETDDGSTSTEQNKA